MYVIILYAQLLYPNISQKTLANEISQKIVISVISFLRWDHVTEIMHIDWAVKKKIKDICNNQPSKDPFLGYTKLKVFSIYGNFLRNIIVSYRSDVMCANVSQPISCSLSSRGDTCQRCCSKASDEWWKKKKKKKGTLACASTLSISRNETRKFRVTDFAPCDRARFRAWRFRWHVFFVSPDRGLGGKLSRCRLRDEFN